LSSKIIGPAKSSAAKRINNLYVCFAKEGK